MGKTNFKVDFADFIAEFSSKFDDGRVLVCSYSKGKGKEYFAKHAAFGIHAYVRKDDSLVMPYVREVLESIEEEENRSIYLLISRNEAFPFVHCAKSEFYNQDRTRKCLYLLPSEELAAGKGNEVVCFSGAFESADFIIMEFSPDHIINGKF